jgi:hypothetical protein
VNDFVGGTAAETSGGDEAGHGLAEGQADRQAVLPREGECVGESSPSDVPWQELIPHNFPAQKIPPSAKKRKEATRESYWDRDPDVWIYRKKTTALLRKYMRWSLEAGRLPSLLGRELFRAKITAYTAITFEDRVIFLHDMERCLERLASFDREIIGRVVLQEHEQWQAARLLHCTRKTIERRLPEVLDELSEAFLKAGLLMTLPETKEEAP